MQPFPALARWSREVQLPVSKISLRLYDTGDVSSPPVLLIHGLGDEADTWRHVLPALAADFRVIAPDLPGFGGSDKGRYKYTIPFFSAVLLELLDALSVPRAILAGHSTGAIIAHNIAVEHPERVEKVVLISGSLLAKENKITRDLLFFLIPGLGERLYNRLRKDPRAAYSTLAPYYNALEDLPQADRDFLYRRVNERVWSDGQRRGFFSTLRSLAAWLPAQQKGLPARLKGWNLPAVVMWGENDRIASPANGRALVDLLPAARLVIVPGAGHNLQQENPRAVVEAIKSSPSRP